MEIIPVLDLMAGQVVHARRGERAAYKPIQSSLCKSAEPLAVVDALLRLYPFATLYIADLDAILKTGNHLDTVKTIQHAFPALNLWIDAGFSNFDQLMPWQSIDVTAVIGTESLIRLEDYQSLRQRLPHHALSLDFTPTGYQGPSGLVDTPNLWPDHVIAMTLARVGSDTGPDFNLLKELRAHSPQRTSIYAAGGIRHTDDLVSLAQHNIHGALIATALHDGRITRSDLLQFNQFTTDH